MPNNSGKLYIVSTPIGNLEDITLRAKRILNEVEIIACEDTRVTKKLLSHLGIQKPLQSLHEHNESAKSIELVNKLNDGKNIAIVSDAGTPCISDPGYRLVKLAAENDIKVITIPGPCAAISGLSISGLATDSFTFIGFLPRSASKIKQVLNNLKDYPHTLIFYESPQRVLKILDHILKVLGDRKCSVSRELTKLYEETLRGNISDVISELKQRDKIRGEFVLCIEGSNDSDVDQVNIEEELRILKDSGFSLKDAVRELCSSHKLKKNEVYETALDYWNKDL